VLVFSASAVDKFFGYAPFSIVPTQVTGEGAISYTSSNPTVATVDAATGDVVIVGVGQTIITATAAAVPDKWLQASTSYTLTIASRAVTLSIDPIPDQTETGSAIAPVIVVKDGTTVLELNKDYTVACSNNTAAGTATVSVTGVGNYAGSTGSASFKILAAPPLAQPQVLTFAAASLSKSFGDVPFTNALTHAAGTGAVSFVSSNPAVATVNAATGEVAIVGVGQTTITATAAEVAGEWLQTSTTYQLTVAKAMPPAIVFPTTEAVTFSSTQTLADIPLVGGSENGNFNWEDSNIIPAVGVNTTM
jgi:uncharacterized protein YjdB